MLSHGDPSECHEITSLEQLNDHQDPTAPGALLKACIVVSGILDNQSDSDNIKEEGEDEDEDEGETEETRNTCRKVQHSNELRKQRPSHAQIPYNPHLHHRPCHQQEEPMAITHDLHETHHQHQQQRTTATASAAADSHSRTSNNRNTESNCTTLPLPSPPGSVPKDDDHSLLCQANRESTMTTTAEIPSTQQPTLAAILEATGGGIEIEMTSSLPVGSGLGTSSILAAATLAVLSVLGHPHRPLSSPPVKATTTSASSSSSSSSSSSTTSIMVWTTDVLIAKTLEVEQRMGTGGGWQDQVGGVLPGLKVGTMSQQSATEKLGLSTRALEMTEATIEALDKRLLLIYTGQTRLAKNLLQTVLGQWASREPAVVQTMRNLMDDAELCETRLENGDLASVGEIMTRYFAHKRFLSSTRLEDPPVVGVLTRLLEPYMDGSVLAGAGGGGFLAVMLRQGLERETVVRQVREQLRQILTHDWSEEAEQELWAWQARIDRQGLCIHAKE
ncbi:hypothetical protein BGW42_000505 [Actinomortierella wolfii]|nr:hypothetical protein BGW42_000505 [Actinomortierella wolfii]